MFAWVRRPERVAVCLGLRPLFCGDVLELNVILREPPENLHPIRVASSGRAEEALEPLKLGDDQALGALLEAAPAVVTRERNLRRRCSRQRAVDVRRRRWRGRRRRGGALGLDVDCGRGWRRRRRTAVHGGRAAPVGIARAGLAIAWARLRASRRRPDERREPEAATDAHHVATSPRISSNVAHIDRDVARSPRQGSPALRRSLPLLNEARRDPHARRPVAWVELRRTELLQQALHDARRQPDVLGRVRRSNLSVRPDLRDERHAA